MSADQFVASDDIDTEEMERQQDFYSEEARGKTSAPKDDSDDYSWDDDDDDAAEPSESSDTKEEAADDQEAGGEEGADDNEASTETVEEPEGMGVQDLALLERAFRANLPAEKIQAFKSDAELERTLDLFEEMNPKEASEDTTEAEVPTWYELPEEQLAETLEPEAIEALKGLNDGQKEATQAVINHEVAKIRDAVNADVAERVSGMQQQLDSMKVAEFEAAIQSLGSDWADTFGKGPGSGLKADSAEYKAREAAFDLFYSGKFPGSMQEQAIAAAKSLHPDKVEKLAKKSNVTKARDRQGRFLGRSDRKADDRAVSPRTKAIRKVTAEWEKRDLGSDETDDDLDLFL